MSSRSIATPGVHGGATADPRLRFLNSEPLALGSVRNTILVSWERSRDHAVAADRVQQPYEPDIELDTPLARSADPVLRTLREQLDGQPMSMVLTDPSGLVLSRRTGDAELDRYLDRVMLAPGFNYAENMVGTNGIGTALEVGGPTYVFGHEHYAENLDRLSCVGVPIRHPISGRALGAIDLTCWAKDGGPLLLALAKSTAEQIRQMLLNDAGAQQLDLMHDYLRTCRRVGGIVLAIGGDTVIMNENARSRLDPVDQGVLLAQAFESLLDGRARTVDVELPSGVSARMHGHPVGPESSPGATVAHVKLGPLPRSRRTHGNPAVPVPLPGLVGSGPVWLAACRQVETASRSGEWLAVAGEPGVGKLALLRAVQLRRHPVRRLTVLDASEAGTDWAQRVHESLGPDAEAVVVRHADSLSSARIRELVRDLHSARQVERVTPLWVALTLTSEGAPSPELRALLRLFPRTVDVPPLRLHLDDVHSLVTFFLGRLSQGENLTCSAEAMQLLTRWSWPGNAGQLLATLRELGQHRRGGAILPTDLPPQIRTTSKRRLSHLESLERDAIVQSLVDSGGDKTSAARSLGVSRATIYRKIREYGIVDLA